MSTIKYINNLNQGIKLNDNCTITRKVSSGWFTLNPEKSQEQKLYKQLNVIVISIYLINLL